MERFKAEGGTEIPLHRQKVPVSPMSTSEREQRMWAEWDRMASWGASIVPVIPTPTAQLFQPVTQIGRWR